MMKIMPGAVLPGNSTVELKDFEIPTPGHGQVLVKTKASTICGSDIRAIYRAHTGKGAEKLQLFIRTDRMQTATFSRKEYLDD